MITSSARSALPIGIFDSGIGGLTVARAIQRCLPNENLLYLGDTARLPYGTKSAATITHYAEQAVALLIAHGIKALVVACNTASAVGLAGLIEKYPNLPIIGVIEAGARVAIATSQISRIVVLATEATVNSGAYVHAIKAITPHATITQIACSVFIALAEEGWGEGDVAKTAALAYLKSLMEQNIQQASPTILLGCTHFPLLLPTLRRIMPDSAIVDPAAEVAENLAQLLASRNLMTPSGTGTIRIMVTDGPARFARVAGYFGFSGLTGDDISLVDLPIGEISASGALADVKGAAAARVNFSNAARN